MSLAVMEQAFHFICFRLDVAMPGLESPEKVDLVEPPFSGHVGESRAEKKAAL